MSIYDAIEQTPPCKPSCEVTRLRGQLEFANAVIGYLLAMRESRCAAITAQTLAAWKAGKGIPVTRIDAPDGSITLKVES